MSVSPIFKPGNRTSDLTSFLFTGSLIALAMMSLVGTIFQVGMMLASLINMATTSGGGFTFSAICNTQTRCVFQCVCMLQYIDRITHRMTLCLLSPSRRRVVNPYLQVLKYSKNQFSYMSTVFKKVKESTTQPWILCWFFHENRSSFLRFLKELEPMVL